MPKPAPRLTNASCASVNRCFRRQAEYNSPALLSNTDWRWHSLLESNSAAATQARNLGAFKYLFAGFERKLFFWYDQECVGTVAAVNPTQLGSTHMLCMLNWWRLYYCFVQPQRRLERQGMQKANLGPMYVYKIWSVSGNTKRCTALARYVIHIPKVMTEKELHSFLKNCTLVQNTSVCERLTLVPVKKHNADCIKKERENGQQ